MTCNPKECDFKYEVQQSTFLAFSGRPVAEAGGDSITEAGKGLHVYRGQPDGVWKLTIDIWNADAPAKP